MRFQTQSSRATATYPDRLLSPVSIHAFNTRAEFEVDIYLRPMPNDCRYLYAAADHRPSASDLQRLVAQGVRTLFVPNDQIPDFNRGLQELLESDADISSLARFEIAKEVAKANFAAAWCRPTSDSLVESAALLADRVIETCRSRDDLSEQISSLLAHDGSTFSHVTNVCVYGVLLATNMGVTDPQTLSEIGVGGLLHDIGKRFILTDLLRKPGKLTPEERRTLEQHPTRGFEELCRRSDMTQGQLAMVYQHHERLDGSGYPVRAVEHEIHWMGKLCAVVDVFDALTGYRSYRKPAPAMEALSFLSERSGTQFDAEMVRCWKNVFSETMATRS